MSFMPGTRRMPRWERRQRQRDSQATARDICRVQTIKRVNQPEPAAKPAKVKTILRKKPR